MLLFTTKNYRSRLFIAKIAITIFSLTVFNALISAHGKQQHIRDMIDVYPFTERNPKIISFYDIINDYLDKPNDRNTGRPEFIKTEMRFSNMTFAQSHRIWYHWGFNTNPKVFPPLKKAVQQNLEYGRITKEDEELFWKKLMKEVGRRNNLLMNKAAEIFGYTNIGSISSKQREQINAFTTILYSIHILGDLQTTEKSVVITLDDIAKDIENAIDNLAGRNPKNMEKARNMKNKIRKSSNDSALLLMTLKQEFTPFLLSLNGDAFYNYKNKFTRLGYELKE